MLLCWCIGKAASEIKEFYLIPVEGKLLKYDELAINTIVKNKKGGITSCDIPFNSCIKKFNEDYFFLTEKVIQSCENHDLNDYMLIGTSAVINTEIYEVVGMNSEIFNNPFVFWGKYNIRLFKTTLTVSFKSSYSDGRFSRRGIFEVVRRKH